MRVRNIGPAILALGILIGAGGCSADSPTSPLVPSTTSAIKGGIPAAPRQDTTGVTTQGGYAGAGTRSDATTTTTTTSVSGGYAGAGT
jgi:hypothetical protein